MADKMVDLKHSPLHDVHVGLGAKMADFGGWEMPIEYPSGGGVLKEHAAVREGVGVFDVSHLGKAEVKGPGAADFVNSVLSNDLRRIEPGKAQYTLCCDASGGVVDDLIAYLFSDDHVFLVPNAANADEVVSRIAAAAPDGITVKNEHEACAVLAVQGPQSAQLLTDVGLPHDHEYMSFVLARWNGSGKRDIPVIVCRTGYTGEHGYELIPFWDDARAVWDALMEAGAAHGVQPVGLGARDTLRTEMGYPLHGQDLSLDISPVQARSGWAVGWDKPEFWGRDALLAEKAAGPRRRLLGIKATDRGIPRPHMTVRSTDGAEVGEVTSGTFSPSLRVGIGLALLNPSVDVGDQVTVDVRGRASSMDVVRPPFVQTRTS